MNYDVGAIRHPGWREAEKNPDAYTYDSTRGEWVRKPHIHVGHNIPGHLPESDVMCFDSVTDAVDALRHEIKDAQDYYYESCEGECPDCTRTETCECEWCSTASDCEAVLSAIADGTAAYAFERDGSAGWIFSPPEGADVHHWAIKVADLRDDCEIFADQES